MDAPAFNWKEIVCPTGQSGEIFIVNDAKAVAVPPFPGISVKVVELFIMEK